MAKGIRHMKKKGILTLILILLCCITGAVSVHMYLTKDTIEPEIYFDQNDLSFSEGEDESVLLSGVTAYDNVDGDITDRIVILRILNDKEGFVTVTYAVMDDSYNVTEKKREIEYISTSEDSDLDEDEDEDADEDKDDE